MKYLRKLLVGLAVAAFVLAADQASAGSFSVGVRIGPPPPRHEVVAVRHHPGHVWRSGYWGWRPAYHRYVWVPGRWIPEHRGYVWVDACWIHRPHGWVFHRGHWRPR